MLEKKTGFPKESELVLCTVTNIQYNSVFAKLDEYKNLQGMIHISEISPGRIRNLRDFVKEGKVIVCKVLKVNEQRGHIDLSLRRVSESQRRLKQEGIKLAQKAEKIIEFAAKKLGTETKILAKDIQQKIVGEFQTIYDCFEDVVENDFDLKSLGLDKKTIDILEAEIRQKIKPASVKIEGTLTLNSYEPNGMDIVKEALILADKISDQVNIYYEGGGHFRLEVVAPEYKEAEKILQDTVEVAENFMEKNKGEFKFDRIETKKS
ncbi:translation initiation factor IF-2 subunit alpha [Candidatus Woesearchaeota archaeon]|nr:MAG: translation initiation factor IF-2 subunit alpha [Candidatus Woesearchaeota archaeon]